MLDVTNNAAVTMTGSNNIGYYLKNGGSVVNNANITGNTGTSNIGIYAKNSTITNNADIILGDSVLTEYTAPNGIKYKTGYSVGIYGEDSNITNSSGRTIQVGKDGIGIYVKGAGYTAENHGIINGVGDDAKGIFAADYATVNKRLSFSFFATPVDRSHPVPNVHSVTGEVNVPLVTQEKTESAPQDKGGTEICQEPIPDGTPVTETPQEPTPETATRVYTRDELSKAAAEFARLGADKREQLQKHVSEKYGVSGVMSIPEERYGEFAADLREMGANI